MAQIRLYARFSWKFRASFDRAKCQLRPRVGNKIPTATHRCEKRTSLSLLPPRSVFLCVGLRIFAGLKASSEWHRVDKPARRFTINRYTRGTSVGQARITGSRDVHLSKRLNYQDLRYVLSHTRIQSPQK